ncbi:hypothetical protein [Aurantimonas sp. 22II-16-19i]|uniref:hypothetical protein n=1 Tax=Aurantimonas sp. 22II-16-19i TaxID=1317114 RepID=UPI00111C37C7|nr:hypothetical protein [Aurantimonas sp. 22II-16-19i]
MAFIIRWRRDAAFSAVGFSGRRAAVDRYKTICQEMRAWANWAVALYECPRSDDVDAAITIVMAGGGLILAYRDHLSNDAAIRELRSILERKP